MHTHLQNRHPQNSPIAEAIFYTSRGHGGTKGWQDTAQQNIDQFTWENLSYDMIGIANYFGVDKFIACGNSMSSSTALYAAMKYPERVLGLILVRVPTAWEARLNRRVKLLGFTKDKILKANPVEADAYSAVVEGIAKANLPPMDQDELYNRVKCPVLILSIPTDKMHPGISAVNLKTKIPQAQVHYATTDRLAIEEWPLVIHDFLVSIKHHENPTSLSSIDEVVLENNLSPVESDEQQIERLEMERKAQEIAEYLIGSNFIASFPQDPQQQIVTSPLSNTAFDSPSNHIPCKEVSENCNLAQQNTYQNSSQHEAKVIASNSVEVEQILAKLQNLFENGMASKEASRQVSNIVSVDNLCSLDQSSQIKESD